MYFYVDFLYFVPSRAGMASQARGTIIHNLKTSQHDLREVIGKKSWSKLYKVMRSKTEMYQKASFRHVSTVDVTVRKRILGFRWKRWTLASCRSCWGSKDPRNSQKSDTNVLFVSRAEDALKIYFRIAQTFFHAVFQLLKLRAQRFNTA